MSPIMQKYETKKKGFIIFGKKKVENNHSHNTTFSYKTSNHLPLFSIISKIYEVLKGKSN